MKVRALKSFEGIKDLERNVYPKEGEIWETSEERASFLKEHGVIEYVEEVPEVENVEKVKLPKVNIKKIIESAKDDKEIVEPIKEKPKKKKTSKK